MFFVWKSTYDRAVAHRDRAEHDYLEIHAKYHLLSIKWDRLVTRINDIGGEDFLKKAERGNYQLRASSVSTVQFTADELKKLRALCHPDKHNGSSSATELSQKINSILHK